MTIKNWLYGKVQFVFLVITLGFYSNHLVHANVATNVNTDPSEASSQAIENVLIIGKHPNNNLFEYASSVSTMSSETIQAWNIQNAEDIVLSMANVDARTRSPMSANISIRSVGSENWHINANQGVAQAVDDVSIQGAYASKLSMFDLQGVAVYRGPQTALFAINSTGGAINFETIKPLMNEFEASTNVRFGRYNRRELSAALNLPLVEDVALRMAMSNTKRDPLWFNAFTNTMMGSVDQRGFRTHLQWDMSSQNSLLVTYQYGSDNGSRVPYLGIGYWQTDGENVEDGRIVDITAPLDCQALLPSNSSSFNQKSNCVTVRPFSGNQAVAGGASDWYTTYDPADDVSNVRFESLKINYTQFFERFELNTLAVIDSVKSDYIESLSNNPFGLAFMPSQTNDKSHWMYEFRLNSLKDSNSVWMVGVTISNSQDYFGTVITRTDSGGARFGIVPAVSIDQDNQTYSGFAAYEYSLNQQWSISADIRYSKNKQSGLSTANVLAKTDNATPSGEPLDSGMYITRTLLQALTQNVSGPCPPGVFGWGF
ncbi:TonB-dependent receptor plug domain-containing protein [Glaciecola sp. KUL10]|uniref:TonB-dependent receptor plug domain-containing protein n=1 Tax=Glaciecola sp. (strain KUL10) TaxID=2161813 RepID=UPI000D784136|nr:TonB-dependent receptor plug domain-containing protein [Glaciecola sp. KUL10]GBL04601.1 hypothetical protein KUL10_19080 [Glaciecola sp. KUL10]